MSPQTGINIYLPQMHAIITYTASNDCIWINVSWQMENYADQLFSQIITIFLEILFQWVDGIIFILHLFLQKWSNTINVILLNSNLSCPVMWKKNLNHKCSFISAFPKFQSFFQRKLALCVNVGNCFDQNALGLNESVWWWSFTKHTHKTLFTCLSLQWPMSSLAMVWPILFLQFDNTYQEAGFCNKVCYI